MKTKFNIVLGALLLTALMSCSTGRYASAQYDANEDAYSNSNGNSDNYDNNNDNYDNNSNYDNNNYNESGSPDVSIDVFVDQLSPYGRWVTSPSYGQVWICNEQGFTPYYTNGHWVYSNFGWTWVSNYNWGWAPFHYGRWAYDPFYGWMWVPGYEWGPAWVGWRTGGDYYGWAPLAPGINISLGFGFGNYMPADRWCFVPRRYISNPYFHRYALDRGRNITIINNTTIIRNTNIYRNARYVVGPDRREVERVTGNRINTVRINNDSRPGTRVVNNNTINMYKPQIRKNDRLTPERVNADRTRSIQAQPNRNVAPQQNSNQPPQQKREVIRSPQQNNTPPPVRERDRRPNKPNINDRINDNDPGIRRRDNNDQNIPDVRPGNNHENMPSQSNRNNPNINRNDRFNQQERINQQNRSNEQNRINQQNRINEQNRLNEQNRINQQNNNRPDSRMERRNNNAYQDRPNPNMNQQQPSRGWQPVQQAPQHRVQPQYQQQQSQGNGRRRY